MTGLKIKQTMKKRYIFSLIAGIFLFAPGRTPAQKTDYSLLKFWQYYADAENSLYKQQCSRAFDLVAKRKAEIATLETAGAWKSRQKTTKAKLHEVLGPFSEKTPLNAKVKGKVKGDGFIVEKVIYESMPGYKVTAALFLPDGKKKNLPAVIYCSGHTDTGFRSETYQHIIINLVRKGFAVLAFDPVGQGERLQYFDTEKGKSKFGATHEHSYAGAQLFINGASAARYFIWDGIRSVDYLLMRKEIDPERIGITGRSGGGTQSAYIAAIDDRIKAAAPECYITSLEYLWKSIGPQDAEQNIPKSIASGIDFADLLEVRAPRPAMMITTTRDFFSIQGARETYAEVKEAYEVMGKEDNFSMVEDDSVHASTKKNREEMYAFFRKHLDNPGPVEDEEVEIFKKEELYSTPMGQLATSEGSKFLFDINLELAQANISSLEASRKSPESHIARVKKAVKRISGYEGVSEAGKPVFSGRYVFDDYSMEKYLIEMPHDRVLPVLLFRPKSPGNKAVLYLDDIDPAKDATYQRPAMLAEQGITVIVPSLPGFGELGPGYLRGDAYIEHTSYNQWFAGIVTDKSTMAIHAEAIGAMMKTMGGILDLSSKKVYGMSVGPFNSSLLHAAITSMDFEGFLFIDPMAPFTEIVTHRDYLPKFITFAVAGSVGHYDLPDIAMALAPRRIMICNAKDQMGEVAPQQMTEQAWGFVKDYYASLGKSRNFIIVKEEDDNRLTEAVKKFFE